MTFRTASADKHKATQDSGVSAVFDIDRKLQGEGELEKETWYSVLQEVMSFELMYSQSASTFFSVKWFNRDLLCRDPISKTLRIIKCTGDASDYTVGDPIISADSVNEKVSYGRIPFSQSHVHLPYLWVFRDVSSSFLLSEQMVHEAQEELEVDIDL